MLNKLTTNYPKATGVLEDYKKYVVSQAKRNLSVGGRHGSHNATKSLHGSIKGYIDKKFNRSSGRFTGGSSMPSLRFEMNEYGKYLDEGVKGSKSSYAKNRLSPYKFGRGEDKKSVPVGPIAKWLRAKGLNENLKYAIGRSIYQKGIERSMFFLKPFKKRLKLTMIRYHKAVADDIAVNIANKIAKQIKNRKK